MTETDSSGKPDPSARGTSAPGSDTPCVAFAGHNCVASGRLSDVAREVRSLLDAHPATTVLILDAYTSEPIEADLRGTPEEVGARLAVSSQGSMGAGRAPGRPRLGVVAHEVTLMPRHWDWLTAQPGGASVTLRKLVEEARRSTAGEARLRLAREACYRFMNTVAGNEPGFEEALRALYAGDRVRFAAITEAWPPDVRDHSRRLATEGFGDQVEG
jgi:uncharacterized protein